MASIQRTTAWRSFSVGCRLAFSGGMSLVARRSSTSAQRGWSLTTASRLVYLAEIEVALGLLGAVAAGAVAGHERPHGLGQLPLERRPLRRRRGGAQRRRGCPGGNDCKDQERSSTHGSPYPTRARRRSMIRIAAPLTPSPANELRKARSPVLGRRAPARAASAFVSGRLRAKRLHRDSARSRTTSFVDRIPDVLPASGLGLLGEPLATKGHSSHSKAGLISPFGENLS